MTHPIRALAFSALAALGLAAATPSLAQVQIDVPKLTCGSYTAMTAGDQLLAVNAVRIYAADSANAPTTGELQATLIDQTDADLQAKVASACKDKPVDTTVFDLLKMN